VNRSGETFDENHRKMNSSKDPTVFAFLRFVVPKFSLEASYTVLKYNQNDRRYQERFFVYLDI